MQPRQGLTPQSTIVNVLQQVTALWTSCLQVSAGSLQRFNIIIYIYTSSIKPCTCVTFEVLVLDVMNCFCLTTSGFTILIFSSRNETRMSTPIVNKPENSTAFVLARQLCHLSSSGLLCAEHPRRRRITPPPCLPADV